jgi:hypothetical protein
MAFVMRCSNCGSTKVYRDAFVEWDIATQEWVVQNVFDEAVCDSGKCDGNSTAIDMIEDPGLGDWMYEVANGDTRRSYIDWLANKTEIELEAEGN